MRTSSAQLVYSTRASGFVPASLNFVLLRLVLAGKDSMGFVVLTGDQKAALKEAQLLSSLDHPNIIAYKECFVDTDESICIVTSFCEEGDLFARIGKASKENFTFQENEVMDMFLQTQNIFIARGGIIVLGDFGISKILAKTADFATTVAGTPYYMPLVTWQCNSTRWVRSSLSNLVNTLLLRESHKRPSLQQIFQMPFVHSHVQRFHSEEKQRLQRQAATMTRRRDAMLKTVQDAKSLSSGDNVESLTPREKKERKKQMENKKRELELQIASMNMQKADRNSARIGSDFPQHEGWAITGKEPPADALKQRGGAKSTGSSKRKHPKKEGGNWIQDGQQ
eukprot:gene14520-20550_t